MGRDHPSDDLGYGGFRQLDETAVHGEYAAATPMAHALNEPPELGRPVGAASSVADEEEGRRGVRHETSW
jgi:hypothetical protein